VVLCDTSHPGNVGAAARAMKTMGLSELYLVNPRCFPHPEAEWRAARASDVLARAHSCATLDEALHGVAYAVACSARSREMAVPIASARQAAARLVEIARQQTGALVFGNEASGLNTGAVNKCQLLATIPSSPQYSSLNLAAAVQVMTYEVRLAALAPAVAARSGELAPHEQVEGFFDDLERTMVEIGFLDPAYPKRLMPRLRRLFARAELEKEEVNILRGLLKALRHPVKHQ
jgi:tRNA/rRNA methyltransferase